ncbi:kinase-like protein [Atractiella rhizophila]|nr:kinase-like protein [Atractiella rhizophila]
MGALCCRPEEIDFDAPVDLWHFYLLRSVGKGAFGKVRVVQHKQTKQLYALKYINKARIAKQHAVQNIIQERRLLEEIDCPFVCNLRYAFQDDENLFMVLDLMLGGDLRFHLDRMGLFSQERVRFYVMELAVALDYLHERGIVHRDIKPDNILLDERGHAHLTDFNIAVHFNERKPLTSIAGSMAYMAPEILAKRGYFSTIDWWSLGVLAYELISLTHSILKESVKMADVQDVGRDGAGGEMITPESASCIRGFLERDINKRLGTRQTGGLANLKRHPWFKGVDWVALERKEIVPPFEPDSKKANFDATHELEELLLEDNPLKAKKRNPNLDINQLSADYRSMEQNFHLYDFTKMQRKSWFNLDAQSSSKYTNELQTTSTATSNSLVPLEDQPVSPYPLNYPVTIADEVSPSRWRRWLRRCNQQKGVPHLNPEGEFTCDQRSRSFLLLWLLDWLKARVPERKPQRLVGIY